MAQFHTTTPTVASVECLQCSGDTTWLNPITNTTVKCPLCQAKGVTHNVYHIVSGKYRILFAHPTPPLLKDFVAPTIYTP